MSVPSVGLSAIISKVRRITGRPSSTQITDAEIVEYIDTYYLYDFPMDLKTNNLKTTYSFDTQPNVDTYTFPRNLYYSVEAPVYVSGYQVPLFQNRDLFYKSWPQLDYSETLTTSTGIAGPYVGTTTATPVLKNSVTISVDDGTGTYSIAKDNGVGGFTGDVTAGSINYLTGATSITFDSAIPAGYSINIKYFPYSASQPLGVLFFHDQFILRPVPDAVYTINMQAFLKPSALLITDLTGEPYLQEWFECLAYGAACKIFAENMDMTNYGMLRPLLDEKLRQCERRTMMQIKGQRTSTIYTDSSFTGGPRYLTI